MRGPEGELIADTLLQERYKITDLVNKGPASRMYKGYDIKRKRYVFLKEMINTFTDPSLRQQAIEQFKCEAKILFKLKHDNLPKFEDYFDYESNRYLILDYIEGKRLSNIAESSSSFLSEKQIIAWGIELCDALYYLHNIKPNPVIFRDLSPQSILLSDNGRLKLIDFGISKIYDSDAKTMGIAKTMTPHYSPIEQHAGTTDERSDIYSLGATLYYLVTKKPPMDCVERIIDEEPIEACRKFNPNLSVAFEKVIMKAMEIDKKDRYQNVEDMKSDLQKLSPNESKREGAKFSRIPVRKFEGDDTPPPEEGDDEPDYKPITFDISSSEDEDDRYSSGKKPVAAPISRPSLQRPGERDLSRPSSLPGKPVAAPQVKRQSLLEPRPSLTPPSRPSSFGSGKSLTTTPLNRPNRPESISRQELSSHYETKSLIGGTDEGDEANQTGRRRFYEDKKGPVKPPPPRPSQSSQRQEEDFDDGDNDDDYNNLNNYDSTSSNKDDIDDIEFQVKKIGILERILRYLRIIRD